MSELITSALKNGDSKKALELAKSLVEQAPDQAASYYWLAIANQFIGDKVSAIEAIDKAIQYSPDNDEYVMLRSIILLDNKDINASQSGLMDTLAFNPNQLNAYIGLIHIAIAQNNINEAKRLIKLAERVSADDSNVIVAKGAIAQAEGNIEEALKYYTVASELNPNSPLALSSLGMCYLLKKMPAFAEQALRRANELAPNNLKIMQALVQSLISQDAFESAEQTVSELLKFKPNDEKSLHLRSKLRQRCQDNAGALLDAQSLLALRPNDVFVLAQLCTLLIHFDRIDEARELLVEATQRNLKNDDIWQLRNEFESANAGNNNTVITNWLEQLPNSPFAHEAKAVYLEFVGDLQAAQIAAEMALSLSEKVPYAQFVKLRQEIRDEPRAALTRAQKLIQAAGSPEAQRMILAWLGIIHDRLQEYHLAAPTFAHMASFAKPGKALPLLYSALQTPEQPIEGQLLWSPVGARIERVFNVLSPILGDKLLADRNNPSPERLDGFGPYRVSDAELAGTATRWCAGVQSLGLETKDVVDWIPHWDANTDSALNGLNLLVLCIDPRDAFINWMVFANAQAYTFLANFNDSAEWLALAFEAVADTYENKPDKVRIIKLDDIDSNAQEICDALQSSLGLEKIPDAQILARPVMALGGMANQFPTGHWRHYQPFYAEMFARLTPVAVRLGYPET